MGDEQVLVTGGSGYVAGWMIVGLLRSGYRVRTTLRSLERQAAVRADVEKEVSAGQRLSFVQADLLNSTGWDAAMHKIDYAMHVASPMGQGQPKADLVTPARDGTLRVLEAASRNGVRRVVFTSSTVTADPSTTEDGKPAGADETVWTDVKRKNLGQYALSKTLAEKAAWEFVDKDKSGLTLTTILPGMILGRLLNNKVSGSVELVSRLLNGKMPAIPNIGFAVTETEALIQLHIAAMTSSDASNQRILGVGDFLWVKEMAELLRQRYPQNLKIPQKPLPDFILRFAALFKSDARFMAPMLHKRSAFDVSKAKRLLRWSPEPSGAAVLLCAQDLLAKGLGPA